MQLASKYKLSAQDLEQFYVLESAILSVSRKTEGALCYLNINCLHQLFWFLKDHFFSDEEKMCLNDHQIQVYLIEYCQIKRRYTNLERIIEEILTHIHEYSQFWQDYSPQYHLLAKVESISNGNSNRESVIICYKTIEEILDNLFQVPSLKNPFEQYRDYLDDFKVKTNSASKPKLPQCETAFSELYSFFTTDIIDHKKKPAVENLLQMIQQRQQLVAINGMLVPDRRITRRNIKNVSDKDLEAYERYLNNRSEIENELKIELQDYEKIDYSRSLRFNTSNYSIPKIDMQILRLVYLYVIGMIEKNPGEYFDAANDAEKKNIVVDSLAVFSYRIQNFVMFLGIDKYRIGESSNVRRFNHKEFYQTWILSRELDTGKVLEAFFEFAERENGNLTGLKDNPSNPEKFIFLVNLISLAECYTQLALGKRTKELKDKWIECSSKLSGSVNLGKIQESLEKHQNLPKHIQQMICINYILNKEQIDQNHSRVRNYLSFHKFNQSSKYQAALDEYLDHCETDETKLKKSYKFFEDNNFNWSADKFKMFLVGLRTFREDIINNRKISEMMGSGIQPNHVKYVKGLYTRHYAKTVKQRKITWEALLDEHILNYSPEIFCFLNKPHSKARGQKKIKQ